MLTRVFPVVLGRPEPWMFSCVKKQALPGPALICQLSLAKTSVICCMLRRSIDRFFDQLTRPLDADDLHRPASVFVRGHVDEGHPHAARSDAVTVQQSGMIREKQLRRGGEHDADVHETLHGDRKSQFALSHDLLAHKAVQHPAKLGQVRIRAELLRDGVNFTERDSLVQIAQIVQIVAHSADAIQDPLIKRILRIVPRINLRVPHCRQAEF